MCLNYNDVMKTGRTHVSTNGIEVELTPAWKKTLVGALPDEVPPPNQGPRCNRILVGQWFLQHHVPLRKLTFFAARVKGPSGDGDVYANIVRGHP